MENNDMKWKTLSQRYLIEKPWLTARVDKVELPTGVVIDEYYVLEYPDSGEHNSHHERKVSLFLCASTVMPWARR